MPAYFLDSSAFVKAYRQEIGTAQVVEILKSSNPIFISRLGQVKVSSAIVRRGRQSSTREQDLFVVLKQIDRDIAECFSVIELSPPTMNLANRFAREYALRGADAIQLACASAADRAGMQPIVFVGCDLELNRAASSERLAIIDPSAS